MLATLPDLEDLMRVAGAVPVSEAARLLGITRPAIITALLAARLHGLCGRCGHQLSRAILRREPGVTHVCLREEERKQSASHSVLISRDELARYTVNDQRRQAGLMRLRRPKLVKTESRQSRETVARLATIRE